MDAQRRVADARAELRQTVDELSRRTTGAGVEVRDRVRHAAVPAGAVIAGALMLLAARRRRRRRRATLLEVGPFVLLERR